MPGSEPSHCPGSAAPRRICCCERARPSRSTPTSTGSWPAATPSGGGFSRGRLSGPQSAMVVDIVVCEGARRGGRFNRRGMRALYTSLTPLTAIREAQPSGRRLVSPTKWTGIRSATEMAASEPSSASAKRIWRVRGRRRCWRGGRRPWLSAWSPPARWGWWSASLTGAGGSQPRSLDLPERPSRVLTMRAGCRAGVGRTSA